VDIDMEYVKVAQFCKRTGNLREDVDEMIEKLGISKQKIGTSWAITQRAADRIDKELNLPPELETVTLKARFMHEANNKRFVFAKIEGIEGKHAVLIPRKLSGQLKNKVFEVEKIEDVHGVSFRHADFVKFHG
jgi:hypothetical protein